jgi:hypothetical protein
MYARVPGLRKQGSVRPTQEGLAMAKDIWLMGIGLGMVVDDLVDNQSSRG